MGIIGYFVGEKTSPVKPFMVIPEIPDSFFCSAEKREDGREPGEEFHVDDSRNLHLAEPVQGFQRRDDKHEIVFVVDGYHVFFRENIEDVYGIPVLLKRQKMKLGSWEHFFCFFK